MIKKITASSKKTNIMIIASAVIIAGAAFGGGLVLSSKQKSNTSNGPIQTQCDGTCVALYSDKANPDAITIASGSFVQFNVADGKKHNLAIGSDSTHHEAGDVETFSSGDFEGDEAWRVQFKKDGAYRFVDKYNDKVRVDVIVYTEGKDYRITQ